MTTSRIPPSRRAARSDGDATRQHILDVAGQVFAERGYADATSKEICARAEVNMASVNYHFGSRGELYEAVLVEAHHHLLRPEAMLAIAAAPGDPRDKLRALLGRIVDHVTGPRAHWGSKVVVRELLSPTEHAPALVHRAIAPKAKILLGIVSDIVGLPPTHPGLQRALFFMMSPCLAMLMAPQELRTGVLPAIAADADVLLEDLLAYVFAGIEAISRRYL
jgi:TetR/AcrR family transcriptional regulator, regulator of cefoperazone and chloramphenicol sensitivity